MKNLWRDYDDAKRNSTQLVTAILEKHDFWQQDLMRIPELSFAFDQHLHAILELGLDEALRGLSST